MSNALPIINPGPECRLMKVDADQAAIWLDPETNDSNRTMTRLTVEKWKAALMAGEWCVSTDGIGFTKSGKLANGQHRLQAVVETGITMETWVMFNLDDDVAQVIDLGRGRSISDTLRMQKESDPGLISASLSWLHKYEGNAMKTTGSNPDFVKLSPTSAVELLKLNPDLRNSIKKGRTLYDSPVKANKALFGALHYVFHAISAVDADAFFEGLISGSSLDADSPVLKLRNALINERERSKSHQYKSYVPAALAVKAWNLYRQGLGCNRLAFRNDEKFPKAV